MKSHGMLAIMQVVFTSKLVAGAECILRRLCWLNNTL